MAEFKKEEWDNFLATVRKYMQLRGAMTQKELAESADIGVSTLSRFMGQKTGDLNPDLIAKITAKLDIPFHEIIDFIDESFEVKFKRLVMFYKGEGVAAKTAQSSPPPSGGAEEDFSDAFSSLGTAQSSATARVGVGSGPKRNIPFEPDEGSKFSQKNLKDKIASLSPRQKAYLTDFLNLDMESRDLMVDLGNNLFRYFKQKGMEF